MLGLIAQLQITSTVISVIVRSDVSFASVQVALTLFTSMLS